MTIQETPISLGDNIVRAILDDRAIETRQPLPEQPESGFVYRGQVDGGYMVKPSVKRDLRPGVLHYFQRDTPDEIGVWPMVCMFGAVGDRLWVREAWNMNGLNWGKPAEWARYASKAAFHYRATDNGGWKSYWGGWRPPRSMPRIVSRITLEITSVRAEHLWDIQAAPDLGHATVLAEGLVCVPDNVGPRYGFPGGLMNRTAFAARARAWRADHGRVPRLSWKANPWVWVVGFKRLLQ